MTKINAYKVKNLSKVDTKLYKEGDHFITSRGIGVLANGKVKTIGNEAPDLSGYAKKTDIPDVSNLASKDEIPDVSNLASKDEIPDVSNLASKDEIPDVSNLATKDEVQAMIDEAILGGEPN